MKIKGFFLLLLIFSGQTALAQVSLDMARKMYFGMDKDECGALKLSEKFGNTPPADPVLLAYYGASTAAAPNCIGNPAKKISYFRKGKQMLEEAVTKKPGQLEIRFLRFATQTKAPSFLGYNANIQEDKKFILENINRFGSQPSNRETAAKIAGFMVDSGQLTKDEALRIKTVAN
ncbi:hypothetical protein [Lentimicrobium sp.]|jgi:hypothetical protein|uniref:hypothetical protein n=1 Tax=Lentimicrobium sp. TaxID=2034841 RepID=UPI002C4FC378|nr:hypothetical protein [Lentimicrobium sp.]HPJ62753.1 hypothetical protein [Lentimicrobium sp.]HPR27683.1 hypothetical protein [Lentimicrobium sp.]